MDRQIKIFNKQAEMYDRRRRKREMAALRSRLLASAEGKVLELGIGAGANMPFYNREIELTGVDFSPAMLERAKEANDRQFGLRAAFIQADVDSLELPDHAYDTVVSTLTLCAYREPAAVLARMSSWCRPGGRVLLMEHGLSRYAPIAFGQRLFDPLAYRFIGCHYDRDILALVEQSPLIIERAERLMAGMLHLLWCRTAG